MRNASILALALVAAPAQAQTAPDLPANPIKAIDGEWYGVDHKIKLSVANGVVTIVENETADLHLKKITAPAGTVIVSAAAGFPDSAKQSAVQTHVATDG